MINPIHPAESGKFNVAPEAIDAGRQRYWGVVVGAVDFLNQTADRVIPVVTSSEAELTKRMPSSYVMPFSIQPATDNQHTKIEAPQNAPTLEHENKTAIEQAYAALAAAQAASAPQSFEDLQVK